MMMKKIMDMTPDELKNFLTRGSITICVVGIGRIGLPTALSFANSGLFTIGLDINSELIKNINSGIYPLKDEPGYDIIFESVIKNEKFIVTSKIEKAIPKSNVILLSLPTPMNDQNIPDYSALRSVAKQLNKFLSPGSIVIIESTIEPGFVENELLLLIEENKQRLEAGVNFEIGVCPETANPGEIMKDFEKLPRLIGGINKNSENIIYDIYNHVFPVELIRMPNCKTANAVKLTTNVFRDVNIAFVNELSLLFEKLGIDTMKVLEAAKTKYNFQVHYPGAGVGGPCLPVNSYQLINSAKSFGENYLQLVKAGRRINESMPQHVVDLILDAFREKEKPLDDSTILILGLSYKPNVKDIQLSPAQEIIDKLLKFKSNVKIYDPFYRSEKIYDIICENNIQDVISSIDAVVLITAHDEFRNIKLDDMASKMKNNILIDSRGVFDQISAQNVGLIFRGLGRGI